MVESATSNITETDVVVHAFSFGGFWVLKHEGIDHERDVPGRHRRWEAGHALPAKSSTEVRPQHTPG